MSLVWDSVRDLEAFGPHREDSSENPPSSSRTLQKRTPLTKGTEESSSSSKSTLNLNFFFFIIIKSIQPVQENRQYASIPRVAHITTPLCCGSVCVVLCEKQDGERYWWQQSVSKMKGGNAGTVLPGNTFQIKGTSFSRRPLQTWVREEAGLENGRMDYICLIWINSGSVQKIIE